MTPGELRARTKEFAIEVIKFARTLPRDPFSHEIGIQLVRSATSVAVNYRASSRSRSNAEFVARMGIVEEEADERRLWLEILVEDGSTSRERVEALIDEADQLVRIAVASIKTARQRGMEAKLRPNVTARL